MIEIQNELANGFLFRAEKFMQQERYLEVIAYATAGLQIILNRAKEDGVNNSSELNEITICYYLGIDIEQYVRYRKMAGYWSPKASGREPYQTSGLFSHQIEPELEPEFDKKDAEISLNYCVKTIVSIEETLDRFNKPLSEE